MTAPLDNEPVSFSLELMPADPVFWDRFVQMLYSLGFLLILAVVAAWIYRQWFMNRVAIQNQESRIKIIEQRALSQKIFLYIIRVDDKEWLVSDRFAVSLEGNPKTSDQEIKK